MNSSRPSSRNNLLNPAQQPVRRAKITVNAQMDISNVPPHAKPITIAPSATSNGTATVRGLSVANHLNTPPPRLTTRTRSSNSVLSNASYKSNSTQPGGGGYTNGTTGSGALTTGADSVVSDDSTMSEDSDRVLDDGSHSQFNGSTLGRASASVISAYRAATVPKTTGGTGRVRTTSSTVGLNNGAGGAAKSMRIAAGASIKVDPPTHQAASSGAGSTVGRSWDEGSTVSVNSSVSTSHNAQQQPIIRAGKANNATGTSIAAANKLAEENRRAEEAARTRRKIADLEISNNSLLSINSSLEATVRKQAAKMQELKLRMQSAHYGDLGISAADIALAQSVDAIELTEADQQDDMIFKRLCLSIDQMVSEAKRALDQATPKSGVKVLTSYELCKSRRRNHSSFSRLPLVQDI
ncbi:hypothetical protein BGW38_004967 [Lunasporangiospora selenospora]|uniref:Uncharacterized protein n=1 Tax=Lunasporangiospora selenospora TaxID=979761 RepID=A0A9P6FPG2_9FUNG|nr:hypothetical protein BGW38_004967 [Lunasporangiospora selenospora]